MPSWSVPPPWTPGPAPFYILDPHLGPVIFIEVVKGSGLVSNDANCDQFQFVKAPIASIMKETVPSTYHEIYKRGSTKQRRAVKFAESWSCIAKFGALISSNILI